MYGPGRPLVWVPIKRKNGHPRSEPHAMQLRGRRKLCTTCGHVRNINHLRCKFTAFSDRVSDICFCNVEAGVEENDICEECFFRRSQLGRKGKVSTGFDRVCVKVTLLVVQ